MRDEEVLQGIVGARLTSVQFVLNYLILGFDERGALTTLVWPIIVEQSGPLVYGQNGYRDSLCGLISQTVEWLKISPEETIFFTFNGGVQLQIPLRSYTLAGERAIFTAPKHILLTL